MATRERPCTAVLKNAVTLQQGAAHVGYAPESLRRFMWSDDPPPLEKFRGRWVVPDLAALEVWAERRS
jgi:hypothetical protein